MDKELRDLVTKFRSLQRQEVVTLINERNVVEIINVISKKKKLLDLVFTSDGREFLTNDELRREIVSEVYSQKRMNVVDLPGALNVDMHLIERAIPLALEEQSLVLHQGELMTRDYLDSIVQDAAEKLREYGFLSISSFVKKLQLPSQFVADLLESSVRSGTLRNARIEDNILFTDQFVAAQMRLLRSALLARTTPVVLTDLIQRYHLSPSLALNLTQQLVTKGEVEGCIEVGQFVPRMFLEERDNRIENLYSSNGFVSYLALSKEGIGNPKSFLTAKFNSPAQLISNENSSTSNKRGGKQKKATNQPTTVPQIAASAEFPLAGHSLSTCFLSDRLLSHLVVPFDTLTNSETHIMDLSEHLPNEVRPNADLELLLPRLIELFPVVSDCKVFDQHVLIASNRLLSLLNASIGSLVLDEVRTNHAKAKQPPPPTEMHHRILLLLQKTLKVSSGSYDDALIEMLGEWEDSISVHIKEAVASLGQRGKFEAKKARGELSNECASLWTELCVLSKATKWVDTELPAADSQTIHKQLIQTKASPLLFRVLQHEAVDLPDVWEKIESAQSSTPNLKQTLLFFEKKKQLVLQPLVDAVANGKTFDGAFEALEAFSGDGSISVSSFHALNKKAEREASAAFKSRLSTELEKSSFTEAKTVAALASTFALCCSVLLSSSFRIYLPVIPGKTISAVVTRLQKEQGSCPVNLGQLKEAIVAALVSDVLPNEETVNELEGMRKALLNNESSAAE